MNTDMPADNAFPDNDNDGGFDAGYDDYYDDYNGPDDFGDAGPSSFESLISSTAVARSDEIGDSGETATVYKPDDSVFSYFDTTLIRRWAGPEHWKRTAVKGNSMNIGLIAS
jgi:hypothetical protein